MKMQKILTLSALALSISTLALTACNSRTQQQQEQTATQTSTATKRANKMDNSKTTEQTATDEQRREEGRNARNVLLDRTQVQQAIPADTQLFFDQTFKTLDTKTANSKTVNSKNVDGNALKLDLYLPASQQHATSKPPLIVWVHGGAWKRGDKTAFIQKNNHLVNTLLTKGYAIASINYRLSGEAQFPAQIQDVNDGIEFLWQNADKYGFDKDRIAIMGRSAGGHLAGLVAMSNHHDVSDFISQAKQPSFDIQALVSFFGVYDFIALNEQKNSSAKSPEGQLLGDAPSNLVDIAKIASPTTYADAKAPVTLLLHGLQDSNVPNEQSVLLHNALDNAKVNNKLVLVEGARHGDPVFDSEQYVNQVSQFLAENFPVQ